MTMATWRKMTSGQDTQFYIMAVSLVHVLMVISSMGSSAKMWKQVSYVCVFLFHVSKGRLKYGFLYWDLKSGVLGMSFHSR